MNLKPVELQVAVHKIGDNAQWHNQQQQKPMLDQAALAGAAQKNTELDRSKSSKTESSAKSQIRDERKKSKSNGGKGKPKEQHSSETGPHDEGSAHPFKGHHIDLSL